MSPTIYIYYLQLIFQYFFSHGYNIWRPSELPSEILRSICEKHDLGEPIISNNKIKLGKQIFEDHSTLSTGKNYKLVRKKHRQIY